MFTARVMAVSLLLLAACNEDCKYVSRCRGDDTVQTCRETWADGNQETKEEKTACEAPNPVCVELDSDHARCVSDATERCGDDFAESCRGDVALRCGQGYVIAQDCADHGNVCVVRGPSALCARPPVTDCDVQTFQERCDGDVALVCDTGVVERFTCDDRCRVTSEERGETAYCD